LAIRLTGRLIQRGYDARVASTIGNRPPASTGRAVRRRDRRKAEIIAVALQILSSSGYQGMNLEEVAERTDIAKATLYHYFPSKDALVAAALAALTDDVLGRLTDQLESVRDSTPTEQLRTLVREQLHVLTVLYPEVGQLFSFPASWPAEHSEAMKAMRRRHDVIFRNVVDDGVRTGEFDCPDPAVALHCLHGVLNHASIWLRPASDPDGTRTEAVTTEAMRLFRPHQPTRGEP
jgi:TetR/AcrR family transcriptional regulator, regulator of autoinduction and epiphytic fitness